MNKVLKSQVEKEEVLENQIEETYEILTRHDAILSTDVVKDKIFIEFKTVLFT